VVGGAGVVVQGHEVALRIEPTTQLEGECRALGVPGGFLLAHPLHAHGPPDLLRQKRRLEPRIVSGRTAVALRTVHPEHAHAVARHLQELRNAVPHPVRLHVVGVDRQLIVRRIGHRMGRTDRDVPLERNVVFGLDDHRRIRQRRVRIPDHIGLSGSCRRRAAHVAEEILRARKRRSCRLLPVDLQLTSRLDRLLFPFADDGNVVAFADHLDEAGDAEDGGLVDAHQLRPCHWRLHVARVHHAGKLDVHGPLQRTIHLGGNVVALRRRADDLHRLYVLHLRRAGGRIGVVAGQPDVEASPANQFAVGDPLRRVGRDGDDALADDELGGRHAEVHGCQIEQDAPGFGRHAAHRPSVRLQRIRSTGAALIDRHVGIAHDEGRLVVCDVQFIGHDLAERGPCPLPQVGLAHVERCRVVLTNDDPRIELSEVGVRIRARTECGRPGLIESKRIGLRAEGTEAHHEHPRRLDEISPGRHAITSAFASWLRRGKPESACAVLVAFTARLIAAWMP